MYKINYQCKLTNMSWIGIVVMFVAVFLEIVPTKYSK